MFLFKRDLTIKQFRIFVGSLLLIAILITTVSLITDFIPGGYSLEIDDQDQVIVMKKGFFQEERFDFEVTKENELKIALLDMKLSHIKHLWYMNIILIPTFLIHLSIFFLRKGEFYLILASIASISLIVLIIFDIFSYFNHIDFFDRIIMGLKGDF